MKKYLALAVLAILAGCGSEGPWPGGLTAEESPYAGLDGVEPATGVKFEDLLGLHSTSFNDGPWLLLELERDCRYKLLRPNPLEDNPAETGTWSVQQGRILLESDSEELYSVIRRLDILYYYGLLTFVDADNNTRFPDDRTGVFFKHR